MTHHAVIWKSIRTLVSVISGRGAKLLELAVTRRVAHMLPQAITVLPQEHFIPPVPLTVLVMGGGTSRAGAVVELYMF